MTRKNIFFLKYLQYEKYFYCEKASDGYNNCSLRLWKIFILEYVERNKLMEKPRELISKGRRIKKFLLCHLMRDLFQDIFYKDFFSFWTVKITIIDK